MISPRLMKTAMPARHVRTLLAVFAVRHVMGLGVFTWLTIASFNAGLPAWWVMALLGAGYAGAVAWNGRKLYGQYRRRLAAERGRDEIAPVPGGKA